MTRALAVLLLAAVPVAAQPATKAEDHYEASRRYYDVEEYDKAIAELKLAYTLSPDPVYLFNIAQAMRKKGDCAGAIDFYRKYLRSSPGAPNKANVESSIKELETNPATCKKIEAKPIDVKPIDVKPIDVKPIDPKPIDPKPGDPKPGQPPPIENQRRTLRITGLVMAGAGVGLLVGGTLVALDARGIANRLEDDCNSDAGCNWGVRAADDDRGRSRATLSRFLIGFGGFAVAGGATMYVVGRYLRPGRRGERIGVMPTTSGGLIVTSGNF